MTTWQKQDIISNLKIYGANSGVKQTPTDCTSISEIVDLFFGNQFFELLHKETALYHNQTLLEDFLELCANVCFRKLLVVIKENENIQKLGKHTTFSNSVWLRLLKGECLQRYHALSWYQEV
jgi:hypothetical protein